MKPAFAILLAPLLAGCTSLSSVPLLSNFSTAPTVTGSWLVTRPGKPPFALSLQQPKSSRTVTGTAETSSQSVEVEGVRDGQKITLVIPWNSSDVSTYTGDIREDTKQIAGIVNGTQAETFLAQKR